MQQDTAADQDNSITVRWPDVVKFVRQISHDLRNDLNAAELQAALIDEITTDPELKSEVRRLREMISAVALNLQRLSARVAEPRPQTISYRVSELLEDLRARIEREFAQDAGRVKWELPGTDADLTLDPQLVQDALVELFTNAFRHGRGGQSITATGKIDNERFVFTLAEPKSTFDMATNNWGREPLRRVSTGHYALGLNRARMIIEQHGGELRAQHDTDEALLRTSITLPVVAKPSANVVK